MGEVSQPVVIVGAGLAGLACARALHAAGVPVRMLEKEASVGGRVRTIRKDGFLLDLGFQIYLTAYPAGQQLLDSKALNWQRFTRGCIVRRNGKFHAFLDPRQHPTKAFASAMAKVGTFWDKLKLARLAVRVLKRPTPPELNQLTTAKYLEQLGFTKDFRDGFFRPFLAGIFLEAELKTNAAFFEFVLKNFVSGDAAVPEAGMQAIPEQLAQQLPGESIQLETSVASIAGLRVTLHNGETIDASAVVLATQQHIAAALTQPAAPQPTHWNSTVTLYFSAKEGVVDKPILILNGEADGCVNNIVDMALANPAYAPPGQHLFAITLRQHAQDADADTVKAELSGWFGDRVKDWQLVERFVIPHALPSQNPGEKANLKATPPTFLCGDYLSTSSINGALESGLQTAAEVAKYLGISAKL